MPKKEKRIPKDFNNLPDAKSWPDEHVFMNVNPAYRWTGKKARLKPPPKGPSKHFIQDMQQGEQVFKQGARTGPTAVYLSKFKTACVMEEERHTFQKGSSSQMWHGCVVARWTSFASRGDSGAVVVDTNGTAVGLLTAGMVPQQCKGGSGIYTVTPIEDVLEDIRAFSGGTMRDVRIPK